MGAGRGKARRAQAAPISEDLAQWLGELPGQLGEVIDAMPDGGDKAALRELLGEVGAQSVPKAQEALRSGEHDELLTGQEALKRAELAGAQSAWEEVQKSLALIAKLKLVEFCTAEAGDKFAVTGSVPEGGDEIVISKGEAKLIDDVLADSIGTVDASRPEHLTLLELQIEMRCIGATRSRVTLTEAQADVFNQLFRVLHCPEGTRVLQESLEQSRRDIRDEVEEDPDFADEAATLEKTLASTEKNVKLGGAADKDCLIVVDIADAMVIDEMRDLA